MKQENRPQSARAKAIVDKIEAVAPFKPLEKSVVSPRGSVHLEDKGLPGIGLNDKGKPGISTYS